MNLATRVGIGQGRERVCRASKENLMSLIRVMHRTSVWLCALLAFMSLASMALASSAAVAETTIPVSPDFKNIKVLRVLDLRSNIVVEDLGIRAKNIHTKPVSQYMFALPRQADEHVASIGAFLRQEPKTGLSIEQAGFDSEKCVLAIVSVCACRIS